MVPLRRTRLWAGLGCGLAAGAAAAHSFGTIYTPPLPFWMYAWGASGALLLSFLLFGLFLKPGSFAVHKSGREICLPRRAGVLWRLGRAVAVALLVLCIATGLLGNPSPYGNFNMSFFWILFALGGVYLSALLGDLYAGLNPWKSLADGIGRLWPRYTQGLLRYPVALAEWPALALYMGFIWIELFGRNTPASLAWLLLGYSLLNLLGVGLIGRRAWFSHCEFFSLIFRLIGSLAPLGWRRKHDRIWLQVRPPLSGAEQTAGSLALLLFILFMLSATAFDGLKETLLWHRLFWVDLYHAVLKAQVGTNPLAALPKMRELAALWNSVWLLLSPLLYLAAFALFVALGKWLGRSERPWGLLMRDFASSLLPIALVYHVAHYYTLIQSQGVKIVRLISDPFGWGWDLFGTAGWLRYRIVPEPDTVWHAQVLLIVAGHVASVYLAHRVALRLFPSPRQALLSQIPMLLLMLLFTAAGLWLLSLPPARSH